MSVQITKTIQCWANLVRTVDEYRSSLPANSNSMLLGYHCRKVRLLRFQTDII